MNDTDAFILSVKATDDDEIFGLTVCVHYKAEETRKPCFQC